MAGFRKDKTTGAQTALNVAGEVTAALVAAGKVTTVAKAVDALGELFAQGFDQVGPVVDADNEVFAAVDAAGGGSKPKAEKKASSKSDDDGPQFKGDADEAGEMAFKTGKFKTLTIAEVDALDKEDAEAYDYSGSGSDYLDFIGSDKNKNSYTRSAVTIYRAG